ncbi:hypothetical protein FEM48_Zijuj08G0066700 [Ziziphus jujuba var. spinosa]|uniref:Uncharacterized protein n=1 Tax=Ziziphus jujuba var. spinosa TaxID=714518 RepID=A0A978UXJ9_ZIZJJ|nr:hypothetical protein FEM48_Zijuj08G0066700 [Ziziphus jujuba var. spinosa]
MDQSLPQNRRRDNPQLELVADEENAIRISQLRLVGKMTEITSGGSGLCPSMEFILLFASGSLNRASKTLILTSLPFGSRFMDYHYSS